jgi:hypothetical protein
MLDLIKNEIGSETVRPIRVAIVLSMQHPFKRLGYSHLKRHSVSSGRSSPAYSAQIVSAADRSIFRERAAIRLCFGR